MKIILFEIKDADECLMADSLSKLLNNGYNSDRDREDDAVKSEVSKVVNILNDLNLDISEKSFNCIVKACKCFVELRRMGFEFYVKPIPMPEDIKLLKILKNSEIKVIPNGEISITPQALAILSNFCRTIDTPFKIVDILNEKGLRIFVGEMEENDEIVVIETNVDDVSGEILGYVLDKISKKALDVSAIQCIGKKGRPSVTIRALARIEDAQMVAKTMMEETGSIGVRILPVRRKIARREIKKQNVEIFGKRFTVRVKVSSPSVFKPEFEDVKRIAEGLGIPLIVAYKEVLRALSKVI